MFSKLRRKKHSKPSRSDDSKSASKPDDIFEPRMEAVDGKGEEWVLTVQRTTTTEPVSEQNRSGTANVPVQQVAPVYANGLMNTSGASQHSSRLSPIGGLEVIVEHPTEKDSPASLTRSEAASIKERLLEDNTNNSSGTGSMRHKIPDLSLNVSSPAKQSPEQVEDAADSGVGMSRYDKFSSGDGRAFLDLSNIQDVSADVSKTDKSVTYSRSNKPTAMVEPVCQKKSKPSRLRGWLSTSGSNGVLRKRVRFVDFMNSPLRRRSEKKENMQISPDNDDIFLDASFSMVIPTSADGVTPGTFPHSKSDDTISALLNTPVPDNLLLRQKASLVLHHFDGKFVDSDDNIPEVWMHELQVRHAPLASLESMSDLESVTSLPSHVGTSKAAPLGTTAWLLQQRQGSKTEVLEHLFNISPSQPIAPSLPVCTQSSEVILVTSTPTKVASAVTAKPEEALKTQFTVPETTTEICSIADIQQHPETQITVTKTEQTLVAPKPSVLVQPVAEFRQQRRQKRPAPLPPVCQEDFVSSCKAETSTVSISPLPAAELSTNTTANDDAIVRTYVPSVQRKEVVRLPLLARAHCTVVSSDLSRPLKPQVKCSLQAHRTWNNSICSDGRSPTKERIEIADYISRLPTDLTGYEADEKKERTPGRRTRRRRQKAPAPVAPLPDNVPSEAFSESQVGNMSSAPSVTLTSRRDLSKTRAAYFAEMNSTEQTENIERKTTLAYSSVKSNSQAVTVSSTKTRISSSEISSVSSSAAVNGEISNRSNPPPTMHLYDGSVSLKREVTTGTSQSFQESAAATATSIYQSDTHLQTRNVSSQNSGATKSSQSPPTTKPPNYLSNHRPLSGSLSFTANQKASSSLTLLRAANQRLSPSNSSNLSASANQKLEGCTCTCHEHECGSTLHLHSQELAQSPTTAAESNGPTAVGSYGGSDSRYVCIEYGMYEQMLNEIDSLKESLHHLHRLVRGSRDYVDQVE